MPYSHLNDYPADIRDRAARIRLACFDVDGTLTDGRLFFDSDGVELKAFHVHDGQGLVLLRKSGIAVAFVTARASVSVSSEVSGGSCNLTSRPLIRSAGGAPTARCRSDAPSSTTRRNRSSIGTSLSGAAGATGVAGTGGGSALRVGKIAMRSEAGG